MMFSAFPSGQNCHFRIAPHRWSPITQASCNVTVFAVIHLSDENIRLYTLLLNILIMLALEINIGPF